MALDKVIQAIVDDGRKEAALIIKDGIHEKERILIEAKIEADRLAEIGREDARVSSQKMRIKELARAEIDAKRLVLRTQKEIIDDVYALALKRLSERPFAETIIKHKSTELTGSLVYCNQNDKPAVVEAIAPIGAKFGGIIDCAGGLIYESSDGKVISDYRLESMLKDVWDDSVTEIVSLLWGGK